MEGAPARCALATSMAISVLAPDPAPATARTRLPHPHALTVPVLNCCRPLDVTRWPRTLRWGWHRCAVPAVYESKSVIAERARASHPALAPPSARAPAFPASKGLDGRRGVAGLGAGSTEALRGGGCRRRAPDDCLLWISPRPLPRSSPHCSLARPADLRTWRHGRRKDTAAQGSGSRQSVSGSALGAHVARGGQASQGAERSHTWCLARASQVGRWLAPPPTGRQTRPHALRQALEEWQRPP